MASKLTAEQNQKIAELRGKITSLVKDDYFKTDSYLFSWLEDSKFKVDKAVEGIKKTMQWREQNKINTIMSEKFDESWMPSEIQLVGHDKDGRPVIVVHPKNDSLLSEKEIDEALTKAMQDMQNTIRYTYYQAELVLNAIKKAAAGNPTAIIRDVVVVFDLKAVKMTDYSKYIKLVFPLARELLKTAADYYPGMLHQCYIINSPKKAIRLMIAMLKPIVNTDLLDRVKVFGRKKEKWEPELLKAIPKEQLLTKYGGTNEIAISVM